MNQIEKALKKKFGIETKIEEKIFYQSKKNQVSRLILSGNPQFSDLVVKFFVWGSAKHEENVLQKLTEKGLNVPEVIDRYGNVLFLKHIRGKTLSFNSILQFPDILKMLALWVAKMHQAFKKGNSTMLKGDLRLQNFIISDNTLWGVDFEEAKTGSKEIDVADLYVTLLEKSEVSGGCDGYTELAGRFLLEYEKFDIIKGDLLKTSIVSNLRKRMVYRPEYVEQIEKMIKKFESSAKTDF